MPPFTCEIPLQRACVWFEETPEAAPSGDAFLAFDTGVPEVGFVAPLLRRRLSKAARGMLHCAHRVAPQAGLRTVFASRHGEMERTLALLKELHEGAGLSPAQFSLSVHNAVAGLWSMAKASRAPSSSVAAGPATFGWGLMEAYGAYLQEPSEPVLYVYGDDRLPPLLAPYAPPDGAMHALALLIGDPPARKLQVTWDPAAPPGDPALPQSFHFLEALRDPAAGTSPWSAQDGAWAWHLV